MIPFWSHTNPAVFTNHLVKTTNTLTVRHSVDHLLEVRTTFRLILCIYTMLYYFFLPLKVCRSTILPTYTNRQTLNLFLISRKIPSPTSPLEIICTSVFPCFEMSKLYFLFKQYQRTILKKNTS